MKADIKGLINMADSSKITISVEELVNLTAHAATQQQLDDTRRELDSKIEKSKDELKADFKEVRTEIQDVRTELKADIKNVRTEIQGVKTELKADIENVRTEIQGVRTEISSLKNIMIVFLLGMIATAGSVAFYVGEKIG